MKARVISASILLWLFIANMFLSCSLFDEDQAPFSLQATPESMQAIPGQLCVFLTSVQDDGDGSGKGKAVAISAQATDLTPTVEPLQITPTQVAEVSVTPTESQKEQSVSIDIKGKREGLEHTKTVSLSVVEGEDNLEITAVSIRDKFIPWLEANHPELGITYETVWNGTIVTPNILIVANYLFFSEDWEMGLTWHVMIPPNDWARIYLRRRFHEVRPSLAFEITSLDANDAPQPINPPDAVLR